MNRLPVLLASFCLLGCSLSEPGPEPDVLGSEAAAACTPFTAPVYHRVQPSSGDSLFTTSASEAANAAQRYGYSEDHGTAFLAETASKTGLSPVYRLYNPTIRDHFWTISAAEKASAASTYGYTVDEGVGFYASTSASGCLAPIYRLLSPTLHKHRFTASVSEHDSLVAAGWVDEGVKLYATPAQQPVDSLFSLAVIPDSQGEIRAYPERYTNRIQWLVAQQATQDVRFVAHVGDMTDWGNVDHPQFERASSAMQILNSAQLPYAIATGNHDTAAVCVGGSACPGANTAVTVRDTSAFNSYFPAARFQALGGTFEVGKEENSFHTFNAGGLSWLVLTLELWPRTQVINWAKTVLADHPRHNVIVVTHAFLGASGQIQQDNGGYGANSPQVLFDNLLRQYANVRLVFSGHVGTTAYHVDQGVAGNSIHEFLTCYHDGTENPTRMVEIDAGAGTLRTWVYSPLTGKTKNDGSSMTVTGIRWVQ